VGAAVHLVPNANGILRRWGIEAKEFGGNPLDRIVELTKDGQILGTMDSKTAKKCWQHPWELVHRVGLHEKLKKVATGEAGFGPPAVLHTSSKVVGLNPEQGTIKLKGGTKVLADVVIGADGIHVSCAPELHEHLTSWIVANQEIQSVTRACVTDARPVSTGKAAFRFMIPRKAVEADPVTAPIAKHKNALMTWYADDRRIVMYPCNNNQLLNFVCFHPETESHATKSDGKQQILNAASLPPTETDTRCVNRLGQTSHR